MARWFRLVGHGRADGPRRRADPHRRVQVRLAGVRHPQTGEVLSIEMAALTNHAAIDGMEPLALRAAATFGYSTSDSNQDNTMNKLLVALIAALGLDANTTEDQAIAACAALKPQLDSLQKIGKEVGIEEVGDGAAVLAACTGHQDQGRRHRRTRPVQVRRRRRRRGAEGARSPR